MPQACDTESYFRTLFNKDDAELHGWSPQHTFPSGIELFRQNEPAAQIYFISSGMVKLSYTAPNGKEMILGFRRRDWLLGVTQVCVEGEVYSATATTLTACAIRQIPAKTFMEMLTRDIELSVALNRMLSLEIKSDTEKIIALGSMPAGERLIRLLSEVVSSEDGEELRKRGSLDLPLKSEELAELIAVTPQHLYRLLKDIRLRPHLKQGRKVLTIVDPLGLMQADSSKD